MGCCALGTCTDPRCHLCVVIGRRAQPAFHGSLRKEANTTRDGVAKKKSRDPVFIKRRRKALTK